MSPRNTKSGGVLEQMVLPALEQGKYKVQRSKNVGNRFGLHKHIIDTYAEDSKGRIHLISLKWQQVAGTAEQKIPFEVISLIDLLQKNENYFRAHLVLGGPGWTYRDFYVSGRLREFIPNAHMVNIMTLDTFVGAANQGLL